MQKDAALLIVNVTTWLLGTLQRKQGTPQSFLFLGFYLTKIRSQYQDYRQCVPWLPEFRKCRVFLGHGHASQVVDHGQISTWEKESKTATHANTQNT